MQTKTKFFASLNRGNFTPRTARPTIPRRALPATPRRALPATPRRALPATPRRALPATPSTEGELNRMRGKIPPFVKRREIIIYRVLVKVG